MRILIAPDKFKGTFSAAEACEAIAEGARRADPGAKCDLQPLADGGEGTVDVLLAARGGQRDVAAVRGPLGGPVEASYALLESGEAVIEMAAAAGLHLVPPGARDPDAHTPSHVTEMHISQFAESLRALRDLGLSGIRDLDGSFREASEEQESEQMRVLLEERSRAREMVRKLGPPSTSVRA